MSSVVVVPSYLLKNHEQFQPAILSGLRHAQFTGRPDAMKFLADGKDREIVAPTVAAFLSAHSDDGIPLHAVVTRWLSNPSGAVAERNEELLLDAETVVVLGPVSTRSAQEFLGRCFGEPGLRVVQVGFDGTATTVGAQNIECLKPVYRPVPKARPTMRPQGWGEFTAPVAKKRGK